MECKHDHHTGEARKNVEANIEKFGCHIVLVESGNYLPGFAYSIGLYEKFNHPEIICFGLKADLMASMANHACTLIELGEKLVSGKLYEDFLEAHHVQFLPVDKTFYSDYFGYAGWYYDDNFDFPALQVVYPDLQGVFPWEGNFNEDWKLRQPLLDRNTDFKFYEERNVCVFTTSQALEGDSILYVYHNEDGAWQFHTSDAPDLNDAKLVCLEELVKQDPTLNDLYSLQYGWEAWRDSPDDDWQTAESPDEEPEEEALIDEPKVIEKPKSLFQKLGKWFK
jgi:hypothetical protein